MKDDENLDKQVDQAKGDADFVSEIINKHANQRIYNRASEVLNILNRGDLRSGEVLAVLMQILSKVVAMGEITEDSERLALACGVCLLRMVRRRLAER